MAGLVALFGQCHRVAASTPKSYLGNLKLVQLNQPFASGQVLYPVVWEVKRTQNVPRSNTAMVLYPAVWEIKRTVGTGAKKITRALLPCR